MTQKLADIVESGEAKHLATGFEFTEGPLWHSDGYWLFVDIRRNLIHQMTAEGKVEVFRENSGGSNGMAFDLQGNLIICEGDNRRVVRETPTATTLPSPSRWQASGSTVLTT